MKLKLIEFLLHKVEWLEKRLVWMWLRENKKKSIKKTKEERESLSKRINVTTTGGSW